ncbi:TetR/AcrR family transcriptional regulator [Bacillus sp. JCM 19034]|uniref:TetR/AcrR family transcriptional regulator n=1 Tax=Bacillus sp. JCM 19034 TaxID=1481928 RepID=UPI0007814B88|nr:TetR/AcrR family transcriptional regulator [Bacillus sp. JCM 19034]
MKKALQETTLELIVEKGLKFTISDVAKRHGVSKRTIYEHFESKQELIQSIVDDAIEEVKQKERLIFQMEAWSYETKLKAILSIVPSGLRFGDMRLLEQMKKFAPKEWEKIDSLLQQEWETVKVVIEHGIQAGEFRPFHVPSVIQLLRGANLAIYDPDFHSHIDRPLSEVLETMVDLVLKGLIIKDE